MKKARQTTHRTNPWLFSLHIGFFAGLIWGTVRLVEFYFQFTKIPPSYWIKPFVTAKFANSNYGYFWGWVAFIVFSMIASMLYAAFLRKSKGPWPGLAYGVFRWGAIFLLIGPSFGMTKWVQALDFNSIITDLCLYAVWGMFIGYSITVEFTDERLREPFDRSNRNPA